MAALNVVPSGKRELVETVVFIHSTMGNILPHSPFSSLKEITPCGFRGLE